MMNEKCIPLLLCGGKGSRFWPLSRDDHPKQFLDPDGNGTLLEKAYLRGCAVAKGAAPYIITAEEQRNTVFSLLSSYAGQFHLITEPFRRDTAAAVYYGCRCITEREGSGIIVVIPVDHSIKDCSRFCLSVERAAKVAVKENAVVLLGIPPRYPATGFGYGEKGKRRKTEGFSYYHLRRFTEKPGKKQAKQMIKRGSFLWNSGIFVFPSEKIFSAFERAMPSLPQAFEGIAPDDPFGVISAYKGLKSVSFDRGILEREKDLFMVEAKFDWDDLGSFDRLASVIPPDKNGNIVRGNADLKNVENSVVISDAEKTKVIGVRDMIVVVDEGNVLVCPRKYAEMIGK